METTIILRKMYALFSADGQIQEMTLAPDFVTCGTTIGLLNNAGLALSLDEYNKEGYYIRPVNVTLEFLPNEE